MSKTFYITTAIDYANGSPHLGHAYEKVLTDIIARHRKLSGDDVFFLTGLDEHGQKVQQSAAKQGIEPQEFCDNVAEKFQNLCVELGLTNNDFIRTTQPRHKAVVAEILQKIYDKGEIYKADYQGFYSTRQEQFLRETDKVNGKWPEIFGEVIEITESNYFFKLSAYQDWLIDHIKSNDDFITPRFRQKQVLEFLKEPLNDLCISRPKERLAWGIPLPFDEGYVTYVWFDALVNYITAAGYGTDAFSDKWPADYHVIGKDILVPPHAVYWPIMLNAAGIELPRCLLVHGWWNISGEKMSKTLGNIVDPFELIERFGPDSLRYFFAREMTVGQDSDFSPDQFLTRYTDDLGNDLGNLVSRLLNMGGRYTEQQVPEATIEEDSEKTLKSAWEGCAEKVLGHYDDFAFHRGLEEVFAFIRKINAYAEQRAPWKLAKSEAPADRAALETSLATMAESLRLASVLLIPVTPQVSSKIQVLLGAEQVDSYEGQLKWGSSLSGKSLGDKTILFPRPQPKE